MLKYTSLLPIPLDDTKTRQIKYSIASLNFTQIFLKTQCIIISESAAS